MDSPQEEPVFGRWLRQRRRSLDLTQKALAGQVGCSAATIRKLEAEERRPSRSVAGALARVLGIPDDEREAFVRFARAGWADLPPAGAGPVAQRPWLTTWSPRRPDSPAARPPEATAGSSSAAATVDGPRAARIDTGLLGAEAATRVAPVVARQPELARLDRALSEALAGRGQVVLISGEAGQGKTTLLESFAERAQATHPELLVTVGTCNAYTGAGDPFQPFREIVRQLTGAVPAGAGLEASERERGKRLLRSVPRTWQVLLEEAPALIGTLVPAAPLLARLERAGAPPPPAWVVARASQPSWHEGLEGSAHSALRAGMVRLLVGVAAGAPLVLFLDDLQWVDRSSADTLLHLNKSLAAHRVLVLGAFRPSDVAAADGAPRHVMQQVVNEVVRVHGEAVLDLDRADGRAFLEALLDSEPNRLDAGFREALWHQTAGQPLFTVELLRALQERAELTRDADGRWTVGRAVRWAALPDRAAGALAERIARLDGFAREILRVASVEGEAFTAEVVARILERTPQSVIRVAGDQLHRRRHLIVPVDRRRGTGGQVSRYRFRHNLIQRFVYESIDEAERSYLHEEVATALESVLGEDADPVALAGHYLRADAPGRAAPHLRRAGDRARESGALRQAINTYRSALEHGTESAASDRAALLRDLGECWFARGDLQRAHDALNRAHAGFVEAGDERAASTVLATLGRVLYERGEDAAGLRACMDAVGALEEGPETRELAMALSVRSLLHMMLSESERSLADGLRAIEISERLQAEDARMRAALTVGTVLANGGPERREEGLGMLEKCFLVADRIGAERYASASLANRGELLLSVGRFEEGLAELERALEYTRQGGIGLHEGWAVLELWTHQWQRGRWGRALAQVPELQRFVQAAGGLTLFLLHVPVRLAAAALDLGRPALARRLLREHEPALERLTEIQSRGPYLRERLRIAAARGRTAEADRHASALVGALAGKTTYGFSVVGPALTACRWLTARPSEAARDGVRVCLAALKQADRQYGPPLARAAWLEARSAVAGAREEPEAEADLARDAAAVWQVAGFPLDEARATVLAGHALARTGRRQDASRAMKRARMLLDALSEELSEPRLARSFARVRRGMLEVSGFAG